VLEGTGVAVGAAEAVSAGLLLVASGGEVHQEVFGEGPRGASGAVLQVALEVVAVPALVGDLAEDAAGAHFSSIRVAYCSRMKTRRS
jgi:hypothetical protein